MSTTLKCWNRTQKALSNVNLVHAGLWDQEASLLAVNVGSGAWGWTVHEIEDGAQGSIEAFSIDSFLNRFHFDKLDYCKLDIEKA